MTDLVIDIDGVPTHYEVHGEGDRVVLLHGALAGASSFGAQIPDLAAAGFQVWVPERRGHGHTPDVPGPLTYQVMADDTIRFLDLVVGGPAHLVGWSDGGVVAVLVAMARPDLVRRLVSIGQYFDEDGQVEGGFASRLTDGSEAPEFFREEYAATSPDGPGHFDEFYAKTVAMITSEPRIPLSEFESVTAETLLLQGDRDEVTIEHTVAVAAAIPNGRIAVLPGSHVLPIESPGPVNALLIQFLRGGVPEPFF
ncbi:alpha/beta fold hydrolase [Actinomycetes bacterium M1A6_2h]